MIRTLQLLPLLPSPPRSGGHLRAWHLCDGLSPFLDQTVLCRVMAPPLPEHIAPFAKRNVRLHTVLIPKPRPAVKMLKGLRFFFSSYPIMVAGWDHRAMRQNLKRLLVAGGFDLVVLDGTPLCSYMPLLRDTNALKVVHLYDLETEFLLRQAQALPPGLHKLMALQDASRMRQAEQRMLRAADLILVTSDRERDILLAQDSCRRIVTVPNGVDCRGCRPLPPSVRQEILYVGSMHYDPNVDAVLYFADAVWPALHARFPNLIFRVVGRGSAAPLARLRTQPGIQVMGEVPDVKPCYQDAALCVVPLRVGGGTRLKILEAMAFGRPVVSTSLGCEGLDTEHNRHLLVADDPVGMRTQIERVLTEPALAAALAANGRALVEQRYSWAPIAKNLYDVYAKLVEERKGTRAASAQP